MATYNINEAGTKNYLLWKQPNKYWDINSSGVIDEWTDLCSSYSSSSLHNNTLCFTGEEVRRVIVRPESKFWTLNTLWCCSLTLQLSVLQSELALVFRSVEQHISVREWPSSGDGQVSEQVSRLTWHYVNKWGNVRKLPEECINVCKQLVL